MTTAPAPALRWYDGVVFSLTMPAALVATLGYSVAAIGTWSAVALWGASMLVANAANRIYTELAAMFPQRAGGIALLAAEAFRPHARFVGPVAGFGYWFAWSSSIAIYAKCAARRSVVSPAQPGGTRRKVFGSNGFTRIRKVKGTAAC